MRSILEGRPLPQYPPPMREDGDGAIPQWKPLCFPAKGMDGYTRPYALGLDTPELAENVNAWPDGWRQRNGSALVGAVSSAPLLASYRHQVANGTAYTYRWTLVGVEALTGATWTAITGPVLTATAYNYIAMTQWGDLLIFSNGVDGTYVLNPAVQTYSLIANAPIATHLTTFNRRVIASVPYTGRIQWCVAGDYTDWTSTFLGAGYEDLLASPGGSGDIQSAVIPVSDEEAHCIRGGSVWQMSPTRQVGSPFAFSRLVTNLGTRWSQSCTPIPGGSAFVSDDRVWTMTSGDGPKDISVPIKRYFVGAYQQQLRTMSMVYSPYDRSLWLSFPYMPAGVVTNSSGQVLHYSFETSSWTRYLYAHNIRSLSSAQYRRSLTIGELSGTIGSQVGVIGDLGVSENVSGVLLTSGENPLFPSVHFVEREAPEVTGGVDVQGFATSTINMIWQTGVLSLGDPSRWVHLHETELEYENYGGVNPVLLTLEMTSDNFITSSVIVSALSLPVSGSSGTVVEHLSVRIPCNRQSRNLRLKMQVSGTAQFKLLDWRVRLTEGASQSMHA